MSPTSRVKLVQNHLAQNESSESDGVVVKRLVVANATQVSIGGVCVRLEKPRFVELVPSLPDAYFEQSQELLRHLRWMLQKDVLGQDMFLIGPPGPYKRHLVQTYAYLTNRELEYLPLSKDLTDADLKQRREITKGTARYVDGPCVRAAIYGRVLVLDGVEKAERNVLPIVNNLLENREMALEDGRFLVHPKRYDMLMSGSASSGAGADAVTEEMKKWKLVRTSDRFIVIALGLPIPNYEGHSLDPPLRSRFQARNMNVPTFLTQITKLIKIAPKVPEKVLERLVSVGMVLRNESQQGTSSSITIPEFPSSVEPIAKILNIVAAAGHGPALKPRLLLDCIYPHPVMNILEQEQLSIIEAAYQRFDFPPAPRLQTTFTLKEVTLSQNHPHLASVVFHQSHSQNLPSICTLTVTKGTQPPTQPTFYIQTPYHTALLTTLLLLHTTSDICILAEKGVGKSALLRAFTSLLGYRVEYIPLYKDMSSRDLLQRRTTTSTGDTVWEHSALVRAAITGALAVLDQLDSASEGVVASLQGLIGERSVALPDGTLLVGRDRYQRCVEEAGSIEAVTARKVVCVHESFRVVGLARPSGGTEGAGSGGKRGAATWLTPEIGNMFCFVPMRPLTVEEERLVVESICPAVDAEALTVLLEFAGKLRCVGGGNGGGGSGEEDVLKSLAGSLSTRQLIRCALRLSLFKEDSVYGVIVKALLVPFLPLFTREALERMLAKHGIGKKVEQSGQAEAELEYKIFMEDGVEKLRIGNISHPVSVGSNRLLIPDIVFYDNPKQTQILKEMLKDYILGENLLLIGNQGVGKNKLVDKLLQLLKLPREYIQLHRDTTIHSLTSTPSIVNGVLIFEDSPLVRAAREGYILVVDEADKAPTYVTSILKSLVEDGEMVLSDGRRLAYQPLSGDVVTGDRMDSDVIPVHKNFRMFVLANRPGFPFLGNDFYAEIGDVFAVHCVGNPDKVSELYLLKKYAPSVDEDILLKLIDAFNDLRLLVDEGLINYPYSTRELVSVVKHLERFPHEGLSRALGNVFDFDAYDADVKTLVITTLSKNGIHIGMESDFKVELGIVKPLPDPVELESWSRVNVKGVLQMRECVVEELRFQFLGGWALTFTDASGPVQRIDVRSVTFTEQVYAFKLPCHGEVLDICGPSLSKSGDPFYVLSTNPISLHVVDGSHRKIQSIDLYEFFPLQKNIPDLRMVEIMTGVLCFHNPDENTLLVLNINEKKVYSMNLDFKNRNTSSRVLLNARQFGILIFCQPGNSGILYLDFKQQKKLRITLPVPVQSVHLASVTDSSSLWVIQSSNDGPNSMEKFLLKNLNKTWILENLNARFKLPTAQPSGIESICSDRFDRFDYPNSSRALTLSERIHAYGAFIKGLPEAIENNRDPGAIIYHWPRLAVKNEPLIVNPFVNLHNAHLHLEKSKQIVTVIPLEGGKNEAILEILDPRSGLVRCIKMPVAIPAYASIRKESDQLSRKVVCMMEMTNGYLLTVDLTGMARVWQTEGSEISNEMNEWKRLVGSLEVNTLSILYSGGTSAEEQVDGTAIAAETQGGILPSDSVGGEGSSNGQGDGGQGGSGGGGASGSGGEGEGGNGGGGGVGGEPGAEGRTNGTVDLDRFQLRTINDVPKEVTEVQRQMHDMAMRKRLEQLKMTDKDMQMFTFYRKNIHREIRELRAIIETTESKNKERVWLRNQSTGDLDDTKLVEGVTGERAIYKRRGEDTSAFQQKPKKMFISFDLSASMTRFNGLDSRLDRSLECALLIMEAFKSFEHKFQYKLTGHSGDGPSIEFVKEKKYPKDEKDMFGVLSKMNGHAKFCLSGDNTVAAVELAVQEVVKEEADDYFCLILSDANITQYNIDPAVLAKALKKNDKVNACIIFIGSIKDQAEVLAKAMPGNAFVCLDTKDLPKILKTIFVNSMLK